MYTRTATFQGVIEIPLYEVPYTIPANADSSHSFVTMSGCQSMGTFLLDDNPNPFTDRWAQSGTAQLLGIENYSTLKIGGGYQGYYGNNLQNGLFAFDSFWNCFSNQNSVSPYSMYFNSIPFSTYANRSAPSLYPGSGYGIPYSGYTGDVYKQGPYSVVGQLNGAELAGMSCILENFNPGGTTYTLFAYNLFGNLIGGETFPLALQMPDYIGANYYMLNGGQIIPDYVNQKNTYGFLDGNSGFYGFQFEIIWELSEVFFDADFFQLQTDDATINAILNNTDTRAKFFYPTARGWLFTTTYGDFYFSSDLTQYWLLSYVPQGNAANPGYGTDAIGSGLPQQYTKNIDLNGWFWYTGVETTSGGETTPLTSFGYNLNLNPVILPAPLPLALPCWSPCANMETGADGLTGIGPQII